MHFQHHKCFFVDVEAVAWTHTYLFSMLAPVRDNLLTLCFTMELHKAGKEPNGSSECSCCFKLSTSSVFRVSVHVVTCSSIPPTVSTV